MKRKPIEQNPVKLEHIKKPLTQDQEDVQEQPPYSEIEYVWGIAYSNGTVMGRYLKEQFDHSQTSFLHPNDWPLPLKMLMSQCLTNQSAVAIAWGKDLHLLYNDSYQTLLDQSKQWSAFGRPVREIFPEIWDQIEPLFASVLKGKSIKLENTLLPIMKDGVIVERYFTFTYSPIATPNGIEGTHVIVVDATADIISRRQFSLLSEIAMHCPFTTKDAYNNVIESLSTNTLDIPFAMLYALDSKGTLRLAGQTGVPENLVPDTIDINQVYDNAIVNGIIEGTRSDKRMDVTSFSCPPCGHWKKSPSLCCVYPIINPGRNTLSAVLVLAVSSMRLWDETYQSFFSLVVAQITTTLSSAEAHEEERARLEKLAEFDRAKTIFFSNISHEFRTPLTLILGPLEDMISNVDLVSIENLTIIHRNTLRLLKLVNSLLDFSRIEAGKMVGNYVPTDICKLTQDLASIFRSGVEKAGLEYIVDCKNMSELVYIDNELWEKIVLNLISNAFKYTLSGKIQVTLKQVEKTCVFSVLDTGIGIAEKDLPHLFKRFYRVTGSVGRHHEGTGIGLALVEELVKLHGGKISVTSKIKEGTCFTITIPLGFAHLPSRNVCHSVTNIDIDESLVTRKMQWWVPTAELNNETIETHNKSSKKFKVLFVDDNADMREFVSRLLSQKYDVEVAVDGVDGLKKAVAQPPHLILSDIMMPNLDGYGLLKELRGNPKTRTLPVIFLSARAGQEPQAEGLESGADDYLVKPFTARELLSRIKAHIKMSQFRVEMAKLEQANEAKDHFLAVLSHELRTPLTPVLLIAESLETNPLLTETVKEDIALIKRNISLEVRLIDDLLDVTKISKGKLEMHMEEISLHEVLGYSVQLLEHDIEEKSMKIQRNLDATENYIMGDPSRIQQILWNIIKNAIKFTPNNGTITIQTKTVENDRILVEITDTGKGIEAEFLPRIFTSFEQEKSSRQFGGLGLGLSISRVIATMHNGSLTVKSPGINQGATFSLELPTIRKSQTSTPTEALLLPPTTKLQLPKHFLVVEDNKPTLLVLQRFLKRLGHTVTSASSVAEALKMAEEKKGEIDLVISDIGLPDASGLQLMQQLKSMYGLRGIALSGYGMESDVQKSKEAGFETHLTKPVQIAVLSAAIQKVFN